MAIFHRGSGGVWEGLGLQFWTGRTSPGLPKVHTGLLTHVTPQRRNKCGFYVRVNGRTNYYLTVRRLVQTA